MGGANNEFFKLGLSQVFRDKENKDLPNSSSIGNKSSDIFGNIVLLVQVLFPMPIVNRLVNAEKNADFQSHTKPLFNQHSTKLGENLKKKY